MIFESIVMIALFVGSITVICGSVSDRTRPPIPPGIAAGVAMPVAYMAAMHGWRGLLILPAMFVLWQAFELCLYLLIDSWRNQATLLDEIREKSVFVRAVEARIDREHRPGIARAVVMSTLLRSAAFAVTEEEINRMKGGT